MRFTDYGKVIICGPGPYHECSRRSEGVRWCFRHRGRAEFVTVFCVEDEPSYCGPWATTTCAQCGAVDGDLFPGWSRSA